MLLNFKKATIFNNDKFSSETNETFEFVNTCPKPCSDYFELTLKPRCPKSQIQCLSH